MKTAACVGSTPLSGRATCFFWSFFALRTARRFLDHSLKRKARKSVPKAEQARYTSKAPWLQGFEAPPRPHLGVTYDNTSPRLGAESKGLHSPFDWSRLCRHHPVNSAVITLISPRRVREPRPNVDRDMIPMVSQRTTSRHRAGARPTGSV